MLDLSEVLYTYDQPANGLWAYYNRLKLIIAEQKPARLIIPYSDGDESGSGRE